MESGIFSDVTAIILAGGQSSRMAALRVAPKAFLKVGGEAVIDREIRVLGTVFKEIVVISNQPEAYRCSSIKVIPDTDRFPGISGPIKGIFSGLQHIETAFAFIVACDMPFINPGLVGWMGKYREFHDVVIPRKGRFLEPLFGYYGKSALPLIEEAMENGVSSIQDVFPKMDLKVIDASDVRLFDPEFESFINLNTPEDLVMAELIIGRSVKTL